MKLCSGTHEEVKWTYISYPKCSVCGMWVGYKTIEEVDGFVDIAKRHYPNGNAVALGARGGQK